MATTARATEKPAAPRAATPLRAARFDLGLELLVAAVVFAVYALAVVTGAGGRHASSLDIGLTSTAIAFVATRSWRFVPRRVLGLTAALPAAALLVCVVVPTGQQALRSAEVYAYAAATFAYVVGFARTPQRRVAVAVAGCGLGLQQFSLVLLPYWGGGDASRKMVGTFYWHNQFGAFMAAIALLAALLAVVGSGVPRRVGQIAAPLCASTVVLSASRGSILVLLGGWAAIGAGAAVQSSGRTRALVRWAALPLLATAITVAMTSALFFPAKTSSGSGLAAVDRRNSEQAPEGSLAFRRAHSRAAVEIFRAHPLAGVGFGGYRAAAPIHLPAGVTLTPYVHNGYLQAAVDGGLLLAVPLAAALLAAVLALLRGLRRRWRALAGSPAEAACALAAMALLAHSAIDMDWVYPALVALVAALLAVAVAGARGQATSPNGR